MLVLATTIESKTRHHNKLEERNSFPYGATITNDKR